MMNIDIEMINHRLLVILSEKTPPSDVPMTPATPLTSNAREQMTIHALR